MLKIIANLLFHGDCRQAFEFYAAALDGNIRTMITYGEVPGEEKLGDQFQDQIMHAWLDVGDQSIMGGDIPAEGTRHVSGAAVAIQTMDEIASRRIFSALADGAEITMPFRDTPWSSGFGMLTDRFGTPWVVNTAPGNPNGS